MTHESSGDVRHLYRYAPAKINLGLHILRKRDDGYHDIETVFLSIPWSDRLEISPADAFAMTCSDPSLSVDGSNLVLRAARELQDVVARTEGILPEELPTGRFHLEKHIPIGAGLGGGSSDAAAALLLLNEWWDGPCTTGDLMEIAGRLGSDVPFFLGPGAAFGSGRGERLEPLIDPETDEAYRPPFVLVVGVPPVAVSTSEAYRLIQPDDHGRPDLREIVLSNDLDRWRRELVNDFEVPIVERYPAIGQTRAALVESGAGYVSLSGSGAAVCGFFDDEAAARGASEALRETGHRVWFGRI